MIRLWRVGFLAAVGLLVGGRKHEHGGG